MAATTGGAADWGIFSAVTTASMDGAPSKVFVSAETTDPPLPSLSRSWTTATMGVGTAAATGMGTAAATGMGTAAATGMGTAIRGDAVAGLVGTDFATVEDSLAFRGSDGFGKHIDEQPCDGAWTVAGRLLAFVAATFLARFWPRMVEATLAAEPSDALWCSAPSSVDRFRFFDTCGAALALGGSIDMASEAPLRRGPLNVLAERGIDSSRILRAKSPRTGFAPVNAALLRTGESSITIGSACVPDGYVNFDGRGASFEVGVASRLRRRGVVGSFWYTFREVDASATVTGE
ncbi:uncharacterized protein C8Q71DRAFT_846023 [Rhodofomes roseus]|uniref:Uncharacterized protein n=1 Tax=Rhodofomes roseus TaxID=34475 RepID=A0ABQ8KRU6_9APHY|nr:uncharacterized protein C8Q71DRAFT_846023 [Rhodofomes roseus]KAH9840654.1 hypothetical protein C8Q71DRAFT_846023 [Rhodofomes roseus]